ncbi:hypothetical protein C479_08388 [Halovivax asiaticus JCM 14624]|uniref:YcaO domain-containing protein n=1 Tax=Halovivax asiaticus JCM 14624 TaxID=1227490 RepID=M0BIX9_9EURY|nr:YcaO-like family protein [Halovivax asiaticus]ELZ10815.1 hypothetical protein C479_08388 [Halovivax asiaticus JCM 14624]
MSGDGRAVVDPQYQRLIGKKTGLINSLYGLQQSRGQPEASLSQPITASVGWLAEADGELELALGGKGQTLESSYLSAIGETVERYSLCFPEPDDFVTASYDELAAREAVIDFEYLDIYSEAIRDERLAPLTHETEISWTAGTHLITGEAVYVPVQLVWMQFGPDYHEHPRFLGTSNGAAAGSSLTNALLGSLYELIERDAFMKMWCRQETPDRVDLSSMPDVRAFVDERIPQEHISVQPVVYDSPLAMTSVGGALINERDERPKFILGGNTSVSPAEAVRGAIVESIQGLPFIAEIAMNHDPSELDPGHAEDNFEENVLYYALPENFDEVAFIVDGDHETRPTDRETSGWDKRDELDYCLEELDRVGYTPIGFDVTTPDVARAGPRVTKVIVPELVPITPPGTLPVNHPAFDGERDELTAKPHPYA